MGRHVLLELQRLHLVLPEAPSLNEMIDLAKQRIRGKPIVYDARKGAYEILCLKATRDMGIVAPRVPWPQWHLRAAEFRLHNLRDPIELLAGLKWPVDFLVNAGFVANDSQQELLSIPYPTQVIDRKNRGVTLRIEGVCMARTCMES